MYAHGRGELRVGQEATVQYQDRNKDSNMSYRRQGEAEEGGIWGHQDSKRFRI